jgi:hypothetical protein
LTKALAAVLFAAGVLSATEGVWHDVYDDAPLQLRLRPSKVTYAVGDTFRISLEAVNTSDHAVLLRRDWREQLVYYHIHPNTGEQVEWPGRVRIATVVDSNDVVTLRPGGSYGVSRPIKVLIGEDVATFDFRVKMVGPKDLNARYAMWQGQVWSNPIRVTVVGGK